MGVLHLTGLNIRKDIFLGLWERLPMEKSNNLSAFLFYSDSKKKKLHDAFVLKMNYYLLFGNEIYSEKVSWNFGDICQYNFRQCHLLSMKGVNKIFFNDISPKLRQTTKILKADVETHPCVETMVTISILTYFPHFIFEMNFTKF